MKSFISSIDSIPVTHPLSLPHLLQEVLVKALVREVDAKLLEPVGRHVLEAEDVQNTSESFLTSLAEDIVDRDGRFFRISFSISTRFVRTSSKKNVRTSGVRKMKEKMRKYYVTEKMEIQKKY